MTTEIRNPFPQFGNPKTGGLLEGGKIYIGEANADPEADPIPVYWDEAKTQLAVQPLRTRGGNIVNGPTAARVFVDEEDYSIRVRDSDDSLISYVPSTLVEGVLYQPLDSDLTAIAALSTTTFGRGLLALADAAALRSAAGIVASLPTAGGTMTGPITRQSAGTHYYANDPTHGDTRIIDIGPADALPTASDGAIVFRRKT